jgi:hypothetical protein
MDVSIIKPLSHKNLLGKENEILELYYTDKAPMLYISDTYGCSSDYITKWFKSNNLKIRSKDKAKKESANSKVSIDMRNSTVIEKYGSWENFRKMQSKIFFEKYGVENPMQLEEHFHTQQKCAKKLKKTVVDGKEISYQGFELLAIHKLIEEGYEIADILNGKGEVPNFIYHFENKRRRYYPDIFIPKDNRIIEVKSKWTYERELDKNLAKRKAALDGGYKFDFYIMEK